MKIKVIKGSYKSPKMGGFVFPEAVGIIQSTNLINSSYFRKDLITKKIVPQITENTNFNISIYPDIKSFKEGSEPVDYFNSNFNGVFTTQTSILEKVVKDEEVFSEMIIEEVTI